MAWLNRGDLRIHYEWIESDNPHTEETMLLVHGVGLDYYSWDFIIPYFRKNYHIVRYDFRGHGGSDAGDEKLTVELLSQDLNHLISELRIKSLHIVAQGFGGLIAIHSAAQNVHILKTLVLIAVPIQYPKQLADKVVNGRKEKIQGQQSVLTLGKEIVKSICYPSTEEKIKPLLDAYRKVSPEVYFALFHSGELEAALDKFQRIEIPILILSGSEDTTYPPELNSANLNFNYNARYFTVPYASFMIQMDQPKITFDWINRFIEKNKGNRNTSEYDFHKDLTIQMYTEIRGRMNQKEAPVRTANQLKVNIMHGFSVHINGRRITEGWGKRKAKQILTYLVIQESATRDDLCDVFWPEVNITNARNRLRVSLHYLKQLLAVNDKGNSLPILVTEREHVYLQGEIQSDLLNHIKAIKDAHLTKEANEKGEKYKQILSERTDNPMPGLYEDWFLKQRNWIESEWEEMEKHLTDS
ncbi:alpha/beta hydrolase [Virgibacillus doumboii]|uniref:alpha/beta hydrolase n=1 Tax=Virgibacillus doumboii TaxID=2697503 RepID=UPI0013E00946|nr:alpha/beta hydrolase [Virgibacillus doumboii]